MGSHVRAEFYFLFFNEKNYAGRPSREYRPWRIFVFELKKIKRAGPAGAGVRPLRNVRIPAIQTTRRFDLDRDCIVQGAIDRDFDLRVHFAEPLRVQGLK